LKNLKNIKNIPWHKNHNYKQKITLKKRKSIFLKTDEIVEENQWPRQNGKEQPISH